MKETKLQDITILEYSKLLISGVEKQLISEIELELSKNVSMSGSGFDLSLFMLQKDLLIFQCKLAIAIFEYDNEKIEFFNGKIEALRKELEKKIKKAEKPNPYKSFLSWILAVEKYLGFAIDKNNDLLYLVEATNQMLNYYEAQKQNIEANKVKK